MTELCTWNIQHLCFCLIQHFSICRSPPTWWVTAQGQVGQELGPPNYPCSVWLQIEANWRPLSAVIHLQKPLLHCAGLGTASRDLLGMPLEMTSGSLPVLQMQLPIVFRSVSGAQKFCDFWITTAALETEVSCGSSKFESHLGPNPRAHSNLRWHVKCYLT